MRIVPYRSKAFDYGGFTSGNRELDSWLHTYAGQNERHNRSRTFVLVEDDVESRAVLGYFALVNHQLQPGDVPRSMKLPHQYAVPATLLTKFAVSDACQGRGIGTIMLGHAMRHVVSGMQFSASELLVVDAIDDTAVRFYENRGFRRLKDDGQRLILSTRAIQRALDDASKTS